ncbi:MAG: hypothetical protein ABF979_15330 [Gluconobacter sp.]
MFEMTLSELIDFLEKQDQSKVIASGWGEGSAHSYRGYYSELAFEARSNVTIADMLAEAKSALGKEFEGYKGGEYVMGPHTDCYLAEYGSCGSELSLPLLEVMCGVGPMIERAIAEAVAAERERYAKVCCSLADKEFGDGNKSDAITALMCAEAIRSAAK